MKLKTALVGLAVLALLGFYASPYWALHQMRAAAVAQDATALAEQVDFLALRDSLKTGLRLRLASSELNERGEPTPAAAMGAAVAGALLGPLVDELITPQSLARLLQGQTPVEAAIGHRRAPRSGPAGTADDAASPKLETAMGYESASRFVFSVKRAGADEEPIELVLHRKGLLGWQLAELRLP